MTSIPQLRSQLDGIRKQLDAKVAEDSYVKQLEASNERLRARVRDLERRKSGDPLGSAEHAAMDLTVDLVHMMTSIISDGPTREQDMMEFGLHIHAIQNMILAQAAARSYPDKYRRLGETL